MIEVADRIKSVKEYYFSKKLREIASMNASGADVINLGIGSPDLTPPKGTIETLRQESLASQNHGYQSYRGLPALRQAFAGWYLRKYHVKLDAEHEILPLIGSKEGIMHISMTYLQPGDEVLVPNPGYPAYEAAAKLAGARVRFYDLTAENNWNPKLDDIANIDLSKVKIMWVNYPHMPTGTPANSPLFQELLHFGEQHNILICNDNPYSFILNDEPRSILPGNTHPYAIELNSLSKSHNMAGWRIGMIAANRPHIENILRFKSNMDSGMFLPIQLAAIQALKEDKAWHESLNKIYRKRREIVYEIMDTLSCTYTTSQVGMFVWGLVPSGIAHVEKWLDQILYNKHVFITPGFIFGSNGDRYVRISLCNSEDLLKQALKRIKE